MEVVMMEVMTGCGCGGGVRMGSKTEQKSVCVDFHCVTGASSRSLLSVLLLPDRCQLVKFLNIFLLSRVPLRTLSVLSQKAFDAFCEKFHIHEEVHHVLPNWGDTLYKRPHGKIRLYTSGFSARVYGTLAAHPSPFQKFLEEFMYMVRLSRHYTLNEETYPRFLHKNVKAGPDLTKVKIVERERVDEIETNIDKLFDEGGSGRQAGQGGFTGVGKGPNIQLVTEAIGLVTKDVAPLQPGRKRKRKVIVDDAVQRLLVGAVLNVEVMGEPIPTLAFVTSSVYTTPKHEDRDHADSVIEPNLQTTSAPSFVPVMTAVTTTTSMASLLCGVRIVVDPETDLQKVYVPLWSVTNGSRLDDGRVCREMVDEFAPPKLFTSIRGMEHEIFLTEFIVEGARQMSLSAEVRMRAENITLKRRG
nr:hypothetical protein [Tanacetum cinerariifolium]